MDMRNSVKKIRYNSPVILTFTIICFIAMVLGSLTDSRITNKLFVNYRSSFLDPMMYVRMFTHIIGHASWDHFFGNFMIILILGPIVEEKYGSKKLLIMILITAFITGLLNVIFFKSGLLGASGIAFMLILISSFVNVRSGDIPLTFIIVLIFFLGKEVFNGIVSKDSISQFAHIVGGMCGSIYGFKSLK